MERLMKKLSAYIIISILLLSNCASAQEKYKVYGTVLDSLENTLPYATVMLLQSSSAQLESYGLTNEEGFFNLIVAKAGLYNIRITYIGYGDFIKAIELSEATFDVNLGNIVLREHIHMLDEVEVKEAFLPMVIKGDTTEYNANYYNLGADASVGDLINQMPGLEVDKEGIVKAHGKRIEKILVENEEFFGSSQGVVTNNISASIIDKVQVFDDKSDFTKFTGIDDGKKETTLNLKLKQGKYKGVFGDADFAGGTPDKRYKASGNINRFDKKKQISFLGSSNNINEQIISITDYLSFTGSMEDAMSNSNSIDYSEIPMNLFGNLGISDHTLLGTNFNYKFNEHNKLHFNYIYINSNNKTLTQTKSEYFFNSDGYTENGKIKETDKTINHLAKIDFKSKIGERQNIRVKAFLSSNILNKTNESESVFILQDSSLNRKTLTDRRINNDKFNLNVSANYYFKLKKQGRNFGFEAFAKSTVDEGFENMMNLLIISTISEINKTEQSGSFNKNSSIFNFNLFYTEPLKKNNYLIFSVEKNNTLSEADRITENTQNNEYQSIIDSLSGVFNNNHHYTHFKIEHRKIALKYVFSGSVRFQHSAQNNTNNFKSYNYILPEFIFDYTVNKTKKVHFEYKTYVNMPNLHQSTSIYNNSNFNYVYTGNPFLEPEYVNSINLNYSTYGIISQKYFFAGLNSTINTNQIINTSYVNEQLQTLIKPENAGNSFYNNAYYYFETPIFKSPLRIIHEMHFSYGQSNIKVNDLTDKVNFYGISPKLELRNRKKSKINTGLGFKAQYTVNKYTINSDYNYYNYSLLADFEWKIVKHWNFNIDYDRQVYPAIKSQSPQSYNFLDAYLSRSVLKGTLFIYIKAINVFNENVYLRQSIHANQYFESVNNRMGRVFLVGLKYSLKKLDK